MTLPHERYVRLLCLLGLDDEEVGHVLVRDDLVVPTLAEMLRVRAALAGGPAQPFDGSPETTAWLQRQQILNLVEAGAAVQQAFEVLRSPVMRVPTDVMVLGGVRDQQIRIFFGEHQLGDVSAEAVAAFRTYFMDTASISLANLTRVLSRHALGKLYLEVLGMVDPAQVLALAERFLQRIPGTRRVELNIGGGSLAQAMGEALAGHSAFMGLQAGRKEPEQLGSPRQVA